MQISSPIHAFRVPFTIPVAPDRSIERVVHVYVILGDREVWLVDSGVAGTEELIRACLQEIGRDVSDISTLLLTHSHPDHIGAAAAIQIATGCDVLIHEAERAWLEDVGVQQQERPVPGFDTLVGGSACVTGTIGDGDRLTLGSNSTIDVLHTPGHSAGSVSFWSEKDRVLITGDALISPGDLPIYDDYRRCVESIERLAEVDGVEVLLSSWDEPKRGDGVAERLQEAVDYLWRIDDVVRKAAAGQTQIDPMGLCRVVVGELGLPPVAVNPLVARALMSHLRGAGR